MKYFIIAGEISGDQHAAKLMRSLMAKDPKAEFSYLGGDEMQAVSGKPIVHIRDLGFMGFTQILTRLFQIRRYLALTKKSIIRFHPDMILLVDFAGFNLRIARWASRQHFRVSYYIAPKVWAWNEKRVHQIKRYTEQVYSILPFEEPYFQRFQIPCTYVGNPVAEDIAATADSLDLPMAEKPIVALLPGSRQQEISRMLPVMLSIIPSFPDYDFFVAGLSMHRDSYVPLIPPDLPVTVVYDQTRPLLRAAVAALVTSGTATLETALLDTPQIVCYQTNPISYRIAKQLIKVPYISLVNLILQEAAVPELIQNDCVKERLIPELKEILPGGNKREQQQASLLRVQQSLGKMAASDNLANLIIRSLSAKA